MRQDYPFPPWLYHGLQWLVSGLVWCATGWRVEGREHVPREGPLLVVANHLNNADPFLLCVAVPRPLAFMAKIELFHNRLLAAILRYFKNFPVDRGAADRQAVRQALTLLDSGHAVGMFPEGTRSRQASLARGLPGVGLLIARSGATVLPVAITGTEHFGRPWSKPRITIRIGPPVIVRPNEAGQRDHQGMVDTVMGEIAKLLPAAYQGVYGDASTEPDEPIRRSRPRRAAAPERPDRMTNRHSADQ